MSQLPAEVMQISLEYVRFIRKFEVHFSAMFTIPCAIIINNVELLAEPNA